MKLVLTAIGFLALAILVFVYLALYYPARRGSEARPRVSVVSRSNDDQAARLLAVPLREWPRRSTQTKC